MEFTAEFAEKCSLKEIKLPKKVLFLIKHIVKQELDRMVQDGIIRKIHKSSLISYHKIKRNDKIRICIDPSDLNKILLHRHFLLKTLEDIVNISGLKYFTN